ncbi:MAG: tRNA (N6-isopentenyl adenosine(37)-C2)-methylthiotransferase MiaB [Acidobacteriota bacterium]
MAMKRFFIETFGCQMNEHDSEKIAGLLSHRGMTRVPSPEEADLFLLNTCSVREKAVQKVYSRLGEVRPRKKHKGDLVIGVVGCVAQQEGKALVKKAPFVDLVVGTRLYHTIPDLLEEIESNRARQLVATELLKERAPVEIGAVARKNDFRAHITVMEGCNKRCSFCIVPFTRGSERNRPFSKVFQEARRAVDEGYVEILLLGQTVNSYRDPDNSRLKFADLLSRISSLSGLRRLRFTSPHPRAFDEATIAVIGSESVICQQVHLPVQSGSTKVLKRMRRQYTRDGFLELVDKFKNCGRPIRFSSDVIVGFPGESEADFEQTLSLLQEVEFESVFSFKYSPRPYTEAERWPNDVPEQRKTERLMMLQRLQRDIQLRLHRQRYLNRDFEVLVEGTARDGVNRFGRTSSNKVVNFPGSETPGTLVNIQITGIGPHSLVGRRAEHFA